mmetsp:Transcript_18327/g.53484  ORF Transcript_18327/g.53484 Transcript_18327/m.53484 type:complete len:868 (+) Transcript_18327:207-2810(+)
MATYLGDRIAELSSQLRTEVSAENQVTAKKLAPTDTAMAGTAARYRLLFGIKSEEDLLLRTTCSMRKEMNAVKDQNVAFGEMYVFEQHLCFDWKVFGFHRQLAVPFADVLAVLVTRSKQVEVQCKGMSYELSFTERQEEIIALMEKCRREVRAKEISSELQASPGGRRRKNPSLLAADLEGELPRELIDEDALSMSAHDRRRSSSATVGRVDMTLTEKDWDLFVGGAKLERFNKDDTVISEGSPTSALYQVMEGRVRVELQIPNQSQSVVVAHRGAGEMFGEISLLKMGVATASIIADSEHTVLYILEGAFLDSLFRTEPGLPSRFYCYLATVQAKRLRELSAVAVSSTKPEVHAASYARRSAAEVLANAAHRRIYRKFLIRETEKPEPKFEAKQALRAFDLHTAIKEVRAAPDAEQLLRLSTKAYLLFLAVEGDVVDGRAVQAAPENVELPGLSEAMRQAVRAGIDELRAGTKSNKDGRAMYAAVERVCLKVLEGPIFEAFLQSEHYGYVLELHAKESRIPGLADFRLVRVLGQGGFGQVLEVVKRDCGKRYAMKVMHKEMMRRSLGSAWQRKIGLERDLLASLEHPFLVNLKYAFQNTEFLVLVMDLVRSADLSEFVLSKRRLARPQIKWVIMEVIAVVRYLHEQGVLYRDLKPENLLVDADGHIRLIDMGLAARISAKNPLRRSRVGTDIYMAPEVRYAKDRKEGYGVSCDWYTVGVLAYELTTGHTPYAVGTDDPDPPFREFDFGDDVFADFVKRMCDRNHRTRLGSGPKGFVEIQEHPIWEGLDWDIVEKRTMPSPMLSLERSKLGRKKKEENQAQQTANDLLEADREAYDDEYHLKAWDFVSPAAIAEEYLENINHCVSTI